MAQHMQNGGESYVRSAPPLKNIGVLDPVVNTSEPIADSGAVTSLRCCSLYIFDPAIDTSEHTADSGAVTSLL